MSRFTLSQSSVSRPQFGPQKWLALDFKEKGFPLLWNELFHLIPKLCLQILIWTSKTGYALISKKKSSRFYETSCFILSQSSVSRPQFGVQNWLSLDFKEKGFHKLSYLTRPEWWFCCRHPSKILAGWPPFLGPLWIIRKFTWNVMVCSWFIRKFRHKFLELYGFILIYTYIYV